MTLVCTRRSWEDEEGGLSSGPRNVLSKGAKKRHSVYLYPTSDGTSKNFKLNETYLIKEILYFEMVED